MGAAGSLVGPVEAERDQCVDVRGGNEHDRSPGAAITPIRPAPRGRLLPMEAETATPAVSGGYVDVDFVDEHAWLSEELRRALQRRSVVRIVGGIRSTGPARFTGSALER
jgi:hypothetical protein